MTEIIKLRGAPALSNSRLTKLTRSAREILPKLNAIHAEHWYFVELSAPLEAVAKTRLLVLLGAHPEGDGVPAGAMFLVTPRL
jgi:phosphoribosylformylglycinamidine synthase